MKLMSGFCLAAGPMSRGDAARWSKAGSAKPLWQAMTLGPPCPPWLPVGESLPISTL